MRNDFSSSVSESVVDFFVFDRFERLDGFDRDLLCLDRLDRELPFRPRDVDLRRDDARRARLRDESFLGAMRYLLLNAQIFLIPVSFMN